VVWVVATSSHLIGPKEKAIVTTAGKYSGTLEPGFAFSLPWPIQSVQKRDVTSIKLYTIPEGEAEKLMLTSDQNLVDLSYLVRWNIKDLKLFMFQLADPDETVREVAEAAMRQSIAEVNLNDAMGAGRQQIEQNVRDRMQRVLDAYRSGVSIQGVDIKKTDPPQKVKEAFQKVTVAQQNAQQDVYNAQQWAQQLVNQSEGNAAEFNKVYEQYKLSPEVTRRRIYYETMVEANGVTPYLPLPELRRKAQEAAPAAKEGAQ